MYLGVCSLLPVGGKGGTLVHAVEGGSVRLRMGYLNTGWQHWCSRMTNPTRNLEGLGGIDSDSHYGEF